MASAVSSRKILDDTRDLVREARALVESGDAPQSGPDRPGILSAYDTLCRMLEGVDPERLQAVIGRVAEQVDTLNQLAGDLERLRRLLQSMRDS